MDKLSYKAIELRYVDAIYELTNIQAIYNAHNEYDKAEELNELIHKLAGLRYDNYNGHLRVNVY